MLDASGRFSSGSPVLTLPNAITTARLCLVPLAVWLVLRARFDEAFGVFLVAGLSDAADGWLARRGAASALGAVLDPLADKALLVSMLVVLAAVGMLPPWLAVLVILRDLAVVGGVAWLWLRGRAGVVRPSLLGKLNTALQIALVAAVLLAAGFGLWLGPLVGMLIWAVAGIALLSGLAYARAAWGGAR